MRCVFFVIVPFETDFFKNIPKKPQLSLALMRKKRYNYNIALMRNGYF
jgi:hypothetical protein